MNRRIKPSAEEIALVRLRVKLKSQDSSRRQVIVVGRNGKKTYLAPWWLRLVAISGGAMLLVLFLIVAAVLLALLTFLILIPVSIFVPDSAVGAVGVVIFLVLFGWALKEGIQRKARRPPR